MREANPPTWLVVQLRRIPKFLKEDSVLSTAPTLNSELKKGRERVSVNRNTLQSSSENIEQAVSQAVRQSAHWLCTVSSLFSLTHSLSVHCSHSLTHSLTHCHSASYLSLFCLLMYLYTGLLGFQKGSEVGKRRMSVEEIMLEGGRTDGHSFVRSFFDFRSFVRSFVRFVHFRSFVRSFVRSFC